MKRTVNRLLSTSVLNLGVFAAMLALSILEAGAQIPSTIPPTLTELGTKIYPKTEIVLPKP
jgi:hypothetical protein